VVVVVAMGRRTKEERERKGRGAVGEKEREIGRRGG
jgi:hypothetical protein